MRFDDTLETVLTTDLSHPQARQSAWRQLVDLIGRRRAAADPRAIKLLADIRDAVPSAVRAASARALVFADPPAPLVRLLAEDVLSVAAPVLASARLDADAWCGMLPALNPSTRSVLRNRRDLPAAVERALASFGPADMVLTDQSPERAAVTSPPVAAPSSEPAETEDAPEPLFADVEAVPMLEVPANAAVAEGADMLQGPFRIADVVARIDAYQRQAEARPARPIAAAGPVASFRFETDSRGALCRVDGVERGPLIGLSLARAGEMGLAEVDGVAGGALRRRASFSSARLRIGGSSDAAGEWRIAGVPAFDPASGRFLGYRGFARRPRPDERAEPRSRPSTADSLRQLVHELRTPAGAIASFAEMIEAQMLGAVPPVYREHAGVIGQHARELLGVIDDLDLAARIEGDALDLRPDTVPLAPLLADIERDLAPLAQLRGAALSLGVDGAVVRGDRRAVERLLARLLATLVSAAAPGETIRLHPLQAEKGAAVLAFDRPAAFADHPGDALLAIDDEGEDGALLGTGFAMRLARNLAKELGGALVFERDRLLLRLPVPEAVALGQANRG